MDGDGPRPLVIGRKERIDFPAWGIRSVLAKVDTGAWTTALDVCECHVSELPRGRLTVKFRPVIHRKKGTSGPLVEAPVARLVKVRCTSGAVEMRPAVETEIRLGPIVKRIRVTLTDRSRMRCPLILGRTALMGDFIVDVSRKFVQRRPS